MKIGDRCFVHGYVDEIRKDIIIIRNKGGYFGTVPDEIVPSAQPERKKGMWIHDGLDFPHGVDWIHCSVCGKKGINAPADLINFCPNCGADMREGQE